MDVELMVCYNELMVWGLFVPLNRQHAWLGRYLGPTLGLGLGLGWVCMYRCMYVYVAFLTAERSVIRIWRVDFEVLTSKSLHHMIRFLGYNILIASMLPPTFQESSFTLFSFSMY